MWCIDTMVMVLDLQSADDGFEYCLVKTAQQLSSSCSHLCASVTKQYDLVLATGQ